VRQEDRNQEITPQQGSEFYITLSRQGHLPEGTRLELLEQILREQSVA